MSRIATGRWLVVSLVSVGALMMASFASVRAPSWVALASATESTDVQTFTGGALQMRVDKRKVDLEKHKMEVSFNRLVSHVELKVLGESKEVLAEESYNPKEEPGETIVLRWTQSDKTPIARMEVTAKDADNNKVRVFFTPWSVKIPHEELHFDSDKANILPSEVHKLEDSLQRIRASVQKYKDIGRIQLFIAGHTDTVGAPAYNMDLSRRRAQAIAAWFLKNGLTIPVAFEGFGETALLIETKDEVDEARNRRVDYILAVEPPTLKKGRNPQWRYLNRAK